MDNEFYNQWQLGKQSNLIDRNVIMSTSKNYPNFSKIESALLGDKNFTIDKINNINKIIKQIYFICRHFIETRHMTRYSDTVAKTHIHNFVFGVGILRHLSISAFGVMSIGNENGLLEWCDIYIKRYVDIALLTGIVDSYQRFKVFHSQGEVDYYRTRLLEDRNLETVVEKQIMAQDRFLECFFPTISGEYVLRYVDHVGEDHLESTIYPKLEYVRADSFNLHECVIEINLTSDHYSDNLVPAMSNLLDILSKMIDSVELVYPTCKYATRLRGMMFSVEDACTKR